VLILDKSANYKSLSHGFKALLPDSYILTHSNNQVSDEKAAVLQKLFSNIVNG